MRCEMAKMTTQEYIKKYGVTETIIIGRPRFPDKITKEWEKIKQDVDGLPQQVKMVIFNNFSKDNHKKLLGFYFYRVDLISKDIIEEIYVPLKRFDSFVRENMNKKDENGEAILFTDLHFNNGEKIEKTNFS